MKEGEEKPKEEAADGVPAEADDKSALEEVKQGDEQVVKVEEAKVESPKKKKGGKRKKLAEEE